MNDDQASLSADEQRALVDRRFFSPRDASADAASSRPSACRRRAPCNGSSFGLDA
jgi:hypothetical protein